MILYKMELLLGVYLSYLASYVHLPEHSVDFSELFFDVSEDWRWIEAATDWVVPVPALSLEDFFIPVVDEFVVVVAFRDE